MPGPFGAASDAGAARVQARLYDQRGRSLLAVFDVTTTGRYHGPVATVDVGYWPRAWAVCDVYLAAGAASRYTALSGDPHIWNVIRRRDGLARR